METLKIHRPLIIALILFWLTILILLIALLVKTEGHVNYILDDPYISMAIARNLAQYGEWGVTRHGFSSSSSSLLWVVLLAGLYWLFGNTVIYPFILNCLFGTALIIFIYYVARKKRLPEKYILIFLLLFVYFTPLVHLVFYGLEPKE